MLGFFSNYFFKNLNTTRLSDKERSIRQTGEYKLISPLLICGSDVEDREYKDLESKIKSEIASKIYNEKAKDISVYFRDLLNSKTVALFDDKKYAPASLLKLPLMIAYYKKAEKDPEILNRKVYFDNSFDSNKNETFKSVYAIKEGWYKIEDLLKAMIVNSDNNATVLLEENIEEKIKDDIYEDLGISLPKNYTEEQGYISVRQYSYFFRLLFNSTYLKPEYSEKALEVLSGPDFPQGIKFVLPKDIEVAQKFGERSIVNLNSGITSRELHDCGIVYYPKKPFLLCIMTKGKNFDDLLKVIQSISQIVYDEVARSR
jgi:beta-lactamase class A